MTQNDQTSPSRDWAKLAQDALDLWQTHLNNLANDPKMKEDMVRMVAPMGDMFTQWASMMQTGMQNSQAQHEATASPSQAPDDAPSGAEPSVETEPAFVAPVLSDAADIAADAAPHAAAMDAVSPLSQAAEAPSLHPASLLSPVAEQQYNDLTAAPSSLAGSDGESPVVHPAERLREPDQSPARGRTASADGPRDLAQLASRLAELERELEGMRSRGGKRTGAELSASDTTDAGDVQRVAGARTRATSP